jgi:hypothetical protein
MDSFEYMATIYEMYGSVFKKILRNTSYRGRKRPEGAAEAHAASNPGIFNDKVSAVETYDFSFDR